MVSADLEQYILLKRNCDFRNPSFFAESTQIKPPEMYGKKHFVLQCNEHAFSDMHHF